MKHKTYKSVNQVVHAIEVTEANLKQAAKFCNGKLIEELLPNKDIFRYIRLDEIDTEMEDDYVKEDAHIGNFIVALPSNSYIVLGKSAFNLLFSEI